jgi:hypothetical protein
VALELGWKSGRGRLTQEAFGGIMLVVPPEIYLGVGRSVSCGSNTGRPCFIKVSVTFTHPYFLFSAV